MRLDARSPNYPGGSWFVYDVPACRMVKQVVWIDTDTAQFGFHPEPSRVIGGDWELKVEQRKKIELVGRTFLLDPLEDGDGLEAVTMTPHPVPTTEGVPA